MSANTNPVTKRSKKSSATASRKRSKSSKSSKDEKAQQRGYIKSLLQKNKNLEAENATLKMQLTKMRSIYLLSIEKAVREEKSRLDTAKNHYQELAKKLTRQQTKFLRQEKRLTELEALLNQKFGAKAVATATDRISGHCTCTKCNGTGGLYGPCAECGGSGWV